MMNIFNIIEFIHGGQVVISFLIFIIAYGLYATRKDKKKSEGIVFTILSFLIFTSTFTLMPYIQYKDTKENIRYFQNNKTLTCISNISAYGGSQSYLVKNNDNWHLRKYSFVQKSTGLLIQANNCNKN